MGSGFETYSDSGAIQFSADLSPMVLVDKWTTTFNVTANNNPPVVIYDRPSSAFVAPVIAFQSSAPTFCVTDGYARFGSDNQWGWWFQPIGTTVGQTITLSLWIYDYQTSNPNGSSNYGLQIFDANGVLTYDAVTSKAMSVIDWTTDLSPRTINVPNGRQYAVAVATPTFRSYQSGQQFDLENPYFQYSPGVIQQTFRGGGGSSGSHLPLGDYGSVSILDVTGH